MSTGRATRVFPRITQPSGDVQSSEARVEAVPSGPDGQVQDSGECAPRGGGGGGAGAARTARAARGPAALGLARPPRPRSPRRKAVTAHLECRTLYNTFTLNCSHGLTLC